MQTSEATQLTQPASPPRPSLKQDLEALGQRLRQELGDAMTLAPKTRAEMSPGEVEYAEDVLRVHLPAGADFDDYRQRLGLSGDGKHALLLIKEPAFMDELPTETDRTVLRRRWDDFKTVYSSVRAGAARVGARVDAELAHRTRMLTLQAERAERAALLEAQRKAHDTIRDAALAKVAKHLSAVPDAAQKLLKTASRFPIDSPERRCLLALAADAANVAPLAPERDPETDALLASWADRLAQNFPRQTYEQLLKAVPAPWVAPK